ncbi:MAG: DUF4199 domain-containing protein [Bacteroidaceae bacterium]|nr:DUF4199 domain-containing protein [Bacteroidaceae bacterium]
MSKANNKEFYQKAMYYGTWLGAAWSVMYLLLFAGTANMAALMICISLFFASPVIAVMSAITYRRRECNDTMSYIQAWIFIFYMYICASMLSALVAFIYFRFFDGGTFFMTLQGMIDESMKLPGADAALTGQLEQTSKILEQTTTADFVWQLLSNNLTNTTIFPFILALFAKKSPKTA